jgi:hypothetical protein
MHPASIVQQQDGISGGVVTPAVFEERARHEAAGRRLGPVALDASITTASGTIDTASFGKAASPVRSEPAASLAGSNANREFQDRLYVWISRAGP